jgi:hypothetical protein
MITRGCWGAIRTGGGAENRKQEQLQEKRHNGENGSGAGAQEARTANAKRKGKKNRPFPTYQIYRPRGVPSGAHAPRALTTGEALAH